MKAKLGNQRQNAKNMHGQRELTDSFKVVVATKDGPINPVTACCWMGRSANSSTVYASIWVNKRGFYTTGAASSGGGGYCKMSDSIGYAIRSAGITLDKNICGAGQGAVHEALTAITRALGYHGKLIIV